MLDDEYADVRRVAAGALDELGALRMNVQTISKVYKYFIKKGVSEELLIDALSQHGNENMAQYYLNSKNDILIKAVQDWAREHGFLIETKVSGLVISPKR